MDIGTWLNITTNNNQQEENMIPMPLLVFHLTRAFGNAKSLVNLITK